MKKITHWVLGTATARVSGDTARFMNIAVKTGLRPIRLQKDGEDVLFTLYAKDYKKLHKIKQRTHARVKLAEKSGFPFRFRRMLRRPGLLLGTALGVALMLFLSGFYWEMTISGEDIPYAESEILAAAKRVGVYIGAPRSTDTALASVALLEELPELSWASFNTEGCTVQLELRTSVTKAEGAEHDGTGDIVASRAGLIHSITAQNGTVLVKVGSACAAGQVLVSGITQVGDPYDPEYNPVRCFYTRARAEILAETQRTFTASCPLSTETVRETDLGTQRALYILGVRVPLSLSGAPKGQTAYTRMPFVLRGHTLPLWVETVRVYEEETVPVTFTEEEAQRRALENLHQLQKLALGEDGRVLTENITYQTKNGAVYVTSRCVCLENIAQEAPLTLPEEPENSENIGVFVGNVQGNG
ncbi:sporulation protein YqfD [Hominenteromicrobium sp.]|uniref:sporulation protein YqfD n=1 Tax=Hominenteromicrobium sp. TaxID=3073581 RepID=UPI003AF0D8AC